MNEITLSGDVGWEITASSLKSSLEEANGEDITVRISSRGGLVGEGLEIFNLIKNYPGKTTAILSGFAMSMGSYIPMSFDEVVAEDNAVMMIHNAQGITWGDHNEMFRYGAILKGLSSILANGYTKFSGAEVSAISAMMDAETWLYGKEIVDSGLANKMISSGDEESNKDGATAAAKTAFSGMIARMASAKKEVINDLTKASAMAGVVGNQRAKEPTKKEEVNTMTLKELKEKYPDLVALIVEEATAKQTELVAEARTEGANAERERIKAVHEQSFPGFEKIVNDAMFDGKSQAGDVAIAINSANLTALKKAGEDLSADAPDAVDEPPDNGTVTLKNGKPETEAQAKAIWDKDAKLRAEFADDFEVFKAYSLPVEGVRVK